MRIIWNEQSIGWFRSASAYTGYNDKLSQLLLAHIPCRESLCDIGCGAGLIDLALAPFIDRITCVDISPEAVCAVAQSARQQGFGNIDAVCADAGTLQGRWDTVLALFFGRYEQIPRYLPLAKERMIVAVHEQSKGCFGPAQRKREKCTDAGRVQTFLEERGIRFHTEPVELEYGQPLRNPADAAAFVQAYCAPMPQAELDAYLQDNLIPTGREDFPLYLPKRKRLRLFVIRRDENEAAFV